MKNLFVIFLFLTTCFGEVSVYFSPDEEVNKKIIKEINKAEKTIDAAIFGFTDLDIAYALTTARNNGIEVRVYRDQLQSREKNQTVVNKMLVDNRVDLKIKDSGILMHMKMVIIDGKTLVTGSYNWSEGAKKQDNDLIICTSPCPIIKEYSKKFNSMWESK